MVFFIFIQILIIHSVCKQWRPDQTMHFATSDLGLHCLPGSNKKDVYLNGLTLRMSIITVASDKIC